MTEHDAHYDPALPTYADNTPADDATPAVLGAPDAAWWSALRDGLSKAHTARDIDAALETARAVLATSEPPLDVESLAAVEHDQWMTWARSILSADDVTIGQERRDRWQSYMVPYADLPESVKEHDRVWARAVLDLIEQGRQEK